MADRAVSTVVNYTLALVVVGLLVTGLLVGMNGHVESQTERVLRSELAVVGNHLAADLATADRLAGTVGPGGTVELSAALPERVAGQSYLVSIESTGTADRYVIVLSTDDPNVSVAVALETTTPVSTGRFDGGRLTVVSDGTQLEVSHG